MSYAAQPETSGWSIQNNPAQQAIRSTFGAANGLIATASRYLGQGNPTGTGYHNWCADFMNHVVRQVGGRPVPSRAAIAWAQYKQHLPGPVVGAVAVFRHHVGIVVNVVGDRITLLSGNHGHRVGIGNYRRNSVVAYVRP